MISMLRVSQERLRRKDGDKSRMWQSTSRATRGESHCFIFLFMYLGEPLQYYQSSNNLPQTAQTLDSLPMVTANLFNMVDHHQQLQKEYNIYSCHGVAQLVLDLIVSAFCRQYCLLWVTLLVVHICLCLNLKPCLVLLNTSSRSNRCRLVSASIFLVLFCSTPRVTLLVDCHFLDLSPSFHLNLSWLTRSMDIIV